MSRVVVTESNKEELEKDYTKGLITAVITIKGPFSGRPIGFSENYKKNNLYFTFNIGDIVVY